MMIRCDRFNIYLMLLLALAMVCGCKTAEGKRKKVLASLRLHQEINRDAGGRSQQTPVGRDHPITFTLDRVPFLTEAAVQQAKVVDVVGGFALQVQFDQEGGWLLEQYTASSRSRHIAIFSQFVEPGEEKLNQGRWLAAPRIQTHITDGMLVFTPDTTREEAEQIALGLNNVAKKLQTGKDVKF